MAELALFISAFLAATILPFSSEAALVVALQNEIPLFNALFFASFGNILAIIFNYYLGYFLYIKTKKRLLDSKIGKKMYLYGHKYGCYALFVSWLPIIGDPLTIVAGLLRINFVCFIILSGLLRIGRYYFVSLMI